MNAFSILLAIGMLCIYQKETNRATSLSHLLWCGLTISPKAPIICEYQMSKQEDFAH